MSNFIINYKEQFKKSYEEIKNLYITQNTQDFINNGSVNIILSVMKTFTKEKLVGAKYEPSMKSFKLMNKFVHDINPEEDEIKTISEFIKRFPYVSNNVNGVEAFVIQKLYEIPESLKIYYSILMDSIKNYLINKGIKINKLCNERKWLTNIGKKEKEFEKKKNVRTWKR